MRKIFLENFFALFFILVFVVGSMGPLAAASEVSTTATALQNGMLVRAEGDSKVYYIENGQRRWITSEDAFNGQGFRWQDIVIVSLIDLAAYVEGEPVSPVSNITLPIEVGVLPDLAPYAATDIRLIRSGSKTLLKFTAKFWNKGKGALELNTTSGSKSVDGDQRAFQRIFRADGTRRDKIVGTLFWHDIHGHYHYNDFADYGLEMVRATGGATAPPAVTQKSTFCMRDDEISASVPEGSRQSKTYTGCRGFRQGVSVGWVDVYPYTLPDQNFDVTNLPAGIYRLSFSVDPNERFIESRRDNNSSSVLLDLDVSKGTIKVVASIAPFTSLANRLNNGLLIRAEGDNKIYVIHNNKKRHLKNEQVFLSYGYSWNSVITLPKDLVEAIPLTGLVRAQGSGTIYALNSAGFRRRILNMDIFSSYGWNLADVTDINSTEFASYPEMGLIMLKDDSRVYSTISGRFVSTFSTLGVLGYNPDSVHVVNTTEFDAFTVKTVAKDLIVPWDIVFLPDGDMLVTERPGTIKRFGANPGTITIPSILHTGEGGLMGMALHPNFRENKFVYLYFTIFEDGKRNRVSRFRLEGNRFLDELIIIDNIPAALYHDGGQIAFGPDGMLYVTTGDAEVPAQAQDRGSLAGKTLRLTPEGGIPADNPFGTAVWSYGHRNAQGIAWDDRGRMWQTEHGRSGALSGLDELNLVEKGKNYGWPTIQGDAQAPGMVRPVRHSGEDVTWAPSGIAYLDGKLYFAGLRGSSLYVATLGQDATIADLEAKLKGTYGRLRAVVAGPDGSLYITTSNRDGRGTVRVGDDKILKVNPDFIR